MHRCGDKACPVNSKEGVGATVAAALVQGGIDYNCGPLYKKQLFNALQMGSVMKADIDRAAARIYTTQVGGFSPIDCITVQRGSSDFISLKGLCVYRSS